MTRIHTFNSISGVLLCSSVLLFLLSCQHKGERRANISTYYFPVEELREPVVYEYRSINEPSLEPEYWLYSSADSGGTLYFRATLYRSDGSVAEDILEEQVDNGMLQRELILYQKDTLGRSSAIHADILHANAFPFRVRDSTLVYLYKARYTQPGNDLLITITRNRRFTGLRNVTVFDRSYAAVEFRILEGIETEAEGSSESIWPGVEYYARHIGLVYYRKNINPTFILEYGLFDRYTKEELWEKLSL